MGEAHTMKCGILRAAVLVLGGLPSSLGCGSEDCSGVLIMDTVHLEVGTPFVAASKWEVTVCQNSSCATAELTASNPHHFANGLTLSYEQGTSGWRLGVTRTAESPKDGDVWSLRIVDQAGGVIFEGSRAVTYETLGDECQYYKSARVIF